MAIDILQINSSELDRQSVIFWLDGLFFGLILLVLLLILDEPEAHQSQHSHGAHHAHLLPVLANAFLWVSWAGSHRVEYHEHGYERNQLHPLVLGRATLILPLHEEVVALALVGEEEDGLVVAFFHAGDSHPALVDRFAHSCHFCASCSIHDDVPVALLGDSRYQVLQVAD